MAYSTIPKPSLYFNTKLYTGNASSNAITGVGFAPDWVWQKRRDGANGHVLFDKVRGATKIIQSESTNAEITSNANQDTVSLDSDGFTVATPSQTGGINANGSSCVAWNWKANGAGSANTDGATASTVSVNTTAGFSIVKYTGAGSTTYGHGLGTTPQMIIIKKLNSSDDWFVYNHTLLTPSATEKQFILLNSAAAFASNGSATTFTSVSNSTFGVGTDDKISESGDSFIAYCFAEKKGYSKFRSYIGNGNADGTFIYTGFKPAFIMVKRTDNSSGARWLMLDNKRNTSNVLNKNILADASDAETDVDRGDFLSNGFKTRSTGTTVNGSGATYIYMAFAEEPLVANSGSNGVPATAR